MVAVYRVPPRTPVGEGERVSAEQYLYQCACDGLIKAIQRAAAVEWQPYIGDNTAEAMRQLRHVVQRARRVGLWLEGDAPR